MDRKTASIADDATDIRALNKRHTLFTWVSQMGHEPIPVVGAEGSWFWDADGNRYLDLAAQIASVNLGHQHPKVIEALKAQAEMLMYASPAMATEPRGKLGEKLREISGLSKTLFTLGGADAVENAIKLARYVTGKHKVITRYRSYHGASYGAITATGDYRRWPTEPGIPGIVRALDPFCYHCPFGQQPEYCNRECVSHIEEIIGYEGKETIAAILVEPIAGANGVIVPPDDYLPKLRGLCDRYDILLICDEVMTGFGRTGKWFAHQHYGIKPDMITCAKGFTSSYLPLGAVIVSEAIAQHFDERKLFAGLTYSGHPLCCAVGLAVLQAYEEEDVFGHVEQLEPVLQTELSTLKAHHPSVGDIRGKGLFAAIELVKDKATRQLISPLHGEPSQVMQNVATTLRANGVYAITRANWILITPPLCICEEELLWGLKAIDRALTRADDALH